MTMMFADATVHEACSTIGSVVHTLIRTHPQPCPTKNTAFLGQFVGASGVAVLEPIGALFGYCIQRSQGSQEGLVKVRHCEPSMLYAEAMS